MSITFTCPVCSAKYTVNDRDAGKKSECKACGQRLQVPTPPQRAKTTLGRILPDEAEPRRAAGSPPAGGGSTPARGHPGPAWTPEAECAEPAPEPDGWTRPDGPGPADAEPPGRAPVKAQVLSYTVLAGGGFSILWCFACILLSLCYCLLWPGVYYGIVFGILGILKGVELLTRGGAAGSPRGTLIMQVICVVNLDVINTAAGIVGLVFLNDPAVAQYFQRRGALT